MTLEEIQPQLDKLQDDYTTKKNFCQKMSVETGIKEYELQELKD